MRRRFLAGLPVFLTGVCAIFLFASPLRPESDAAKDSPKDEARALARKAKRAQKAGHDSEAFLFYSQAAAQLPGDKRYKALMESLRPQKRKRRQPGTAPPSPMVPIWRRKRFSTV